MHFHLTIFELLREIMWITIVLLGFLLLKLKGPPVM